MDRVNCSYRLLVRAGLMLVIGVTVLAGCGAPGPIMPDGRGSSSTSASTSSTARNSSSAPTVYPVNRGDTLYSIAFRYGMDWREVARWNEISAPYTIQIGQRIRLRPPVNRSVSTSTPSAAPGQASGIGTPPRSVSSRTLDPAPSTGESEAATNTATLATVPLPPITAPSPDAGADFTPSTETETETSTTARPGSSTAPTPTAAGGRGADQANIVTSGRGRSVAGATWFWPTEGRLTQRFNANDTRKGIHIAGEDGQAIRTAANGEVVYSGNGLIGYGELIIIKHTDSMLSAYAHNDRRLVQQGDRVQAGQIIARMGEFEPNRPLLHFEIRRNGQPDDPLKYLPPR
ncbi:MAG: peptidoglycan DD-metalloendopeptidase family protein [Pseudomonadota bacterium]